ncbi:CobW family GTP-binding protein [Amycolatopsis sp. NPDC054798]
MAKIPVTVLTGFLGSGKTTLVNHILTADHGHRIAVIENEFGEIPIDNALVLGGDEKIIEMSNGCCLCCTARTDLIEILQSLLRRRERFDRILIETSGMADPNPVAQTFFVDDEVSSAFALDAIVTLVDARHVGSHLEEGEHDGVGGQVSNQIAFADRIVLNKIDLVTEPEIEELRAQLRSVNATADILTSSYGSVDLDDILGINAFDLNRTVAADPDWLEDESHHHDPTLESVSIELDYPLDRAAFEQWLTALLAERGDDLYRFKGILAFDRRTVLQGVHRIYELTDAGEQGAQPPVSKLVLIGRNLDRAELTDTVSRCSLAAAGR